MGDFRHVPQTISLRDVAIGVKWGSLADVSDRVEREPADEIMSGAESPALQRHGLCDVCHAASPELSRAMGGKSKHPEDVYF